METYSIGDHFYLYINVKVVASTITDEEKEKHTEDKKENATS